MRLRNASILRLIVTSLAISILAVALAVRKRGTHRRAYGGPAHGHVTVND